MKLENVAFVTVETVEEIHDAVIASSGGSQGVLNRHLLLSAIEAPKATFDGQPLHTSLAEVAAGYVFGIARNHPFVDGNKRTALMTAWTFIDTHGYRIVLNDAWKDLMVRVANEPAFDRRELVRAFASQMDFNDPIE